MIKKIVFATILIFWISLAAGSIAWWLYPNIKEQANVPIVNNPILVKPRQASTQQPTPPRIVKPIQPISQPTPLVSPPTPPPNISNILNKAAIAKHNTPDDCWLIIYGKVYDLTSFLYGHSGGAEAITPYCGQDGTKAFATKDGNGSHESRDLSILDRYYVGNLVK